MRTPEEILAHWKLLPPKERRRVAEELLDSLDGEAAGEARTRVAAGKVVGGKVVVEGEPFEEGATVAVLALADDDAFDLSPEQEAELIRRMEEVRQGNYVDGDEFIRRHLT